ncbi:unnamed protein product [Prorocentrum cordatum]|uniref:Uncharacterized protein n=1 Tax=Prorocentrum cordatum TaxID=2364126 RepID=A0ABN9S3Y1_9DINO|nr:unnamed protein product [Polarella glacialis]
MPRRALRALSLLLPLRSAALTILDDGRGEGSLQSGARAASGANATESEPPEAAVLRAGPPALWPGVWLAGLEQLPSLADAALRPPEGGALWGRGTLAAAPRESLSRMLFPASVRSARPTRSGARTRRMRPGWRPSAPSSLPWPWGWPR